MPTRPRDQHVARLATERALLGEAILSPSVLDAADDLDAYSWSSPGHHVLWSYLRDLRARHPTVTLAWPDIVLYEARRWEEVGGVRLVAILARRDPSPGIATAALADVRQLALAEAIDREDAIESHPELTPAPPARRPLG